MPRLAIDPGRAAGNGTAGAIPRHGVVVEITLGRLTPVDSQLR
jgi:hypothetical protein